MLRLIGNNKRAYKCRTHALSSYYAYTVYLIFCRQYLQIGMRYLFSNSYLDLKIDLR